MRVLVTGGTGYVGSHTVAALVRAGHDVRLLVRSPDRIAPALSPLGIGALDYVTGDILDLESVQSALDGCESVIHVASPYAMGVTFAGARRLIHTAVTGTRNVLETAHRRGLDPIVHVSSVWALISSERDATFTEQSAIGSAPSAYPRSKVACEKIARGLQARDAPVVITYPGGVLGPPDPYWGETCETIEHALRGLFRFGLRGRFSLSDVQDVAALHEAVLEPGRGPRRFVAPMYNASIAEILAAVSKAIGRDLPTTELPSGLLLAAGRVLQLLQLLVPFRLPIQYAVLWYVSRNSIFDDSRTRAAFGLEPRPLADVLLDQLEWMAGSGRIPRRLLGVLARAARG